MCLLNMVYIPVCTIYWYIRVCTMYHHIFHSNQGGAALQRRFVSAAFFCCASPTALFLATVCSIVRPPKRGLPQPNCPGQQPQVYRHTAASPSIHSSRVSTTEQEAHPSSCSLETRILLFKFRPVLPPCHSFGGIPLDGPCMPHRCCAYPGLRQKVARPVPDNLSASNPIVGHGW